MLESFYFMVSEYNDRVKLIIKQKNEDFKELMEQIEDVVPLFIPIYVNNRDEARRAMFDAGIFCPVHWSNQQTNHAQEIAKHELSLIIDQRYDEADMNRIVEIIEKYAR